MKKLFSFSDNHCIQKFSSDGTFLAKWGSCGAGDGQLNSPTGIAIDGIGNVYVTDSVNNRIQKFSSNGTFLAKWGSSGSGDGQFDSPWGIAIDGSGNVYVVDTGNNRIQKFSSNGTFLAKWESCGAGDGQFDSPWGIAIDGSGNVYVVDTGNNRIQKFSSNGTFLAKWGSSGSGDGQFNYPLGIAIDGSGNVYVTDSDNHCIQKFSSNGTFLAKWGSCGAGDGQFNYPWGIAIDGSGNVYVVDTGNNRIQKFSSNGTFLAKWGSFGSGDGQFNYPEGIAIDGSGNVYVTDTDNNRIQKFTYGGSVTTPQPDISISPTSYNFGNIAIGSTKTQVFTVTNTGSADLVIGNLSITGTDEFSIQNDSCSGQTIAPSGTCAVEVKFSPASTGAKSATLNIPSNDPDENPLNISLTGSGITPQPDISISPASYNFGNIAIGSTKTQIFTVTNTGSADLVVGTLAITGTDVAEFSIQNDSCSGQTIAPSGTCAVEVKFSPASTGAKSATLNIPSNDPDENTLSVPLTNTEASSSSGGGGGGGGGGGCFITSIRIL